GMEFTPDARLPDPERQIRAYTQSAATLNLLRAFTQGGYADIHRIRGWMLGFVSKSPQSDRFLDLANRIDESLRFMEACGLTPE
ncbi:3-deoxy-7-phosphoheptulonate synthase, partial [Salmonella enterica]|uniref:3-deoxy-7-phosphoheptulonate synthase n=1 Tax=Salmonella enterica TaxID=28901 RepID=UPI003D2E2BE1